jgi:hypothetical protein
VEKPGAPAPRLIIYQSNLSPSPALQVDVPFLFRRGSCNRAGSLSFFGRLRSQSQLGEERRSGPWPCRVPDRPPRRPIETIMMRCNACRKENHTIPYVCDLGATAPRCHFACSRQSLSNTTSSSTARVNQDCIRKCLLIHHYPPGN